MTATAESQCAFEVEPTALSARAFVTALARERGAPYDALLPLVDAPEDERSIGELRGVAAALPEDRRRAVLCEALGCLLEAWDDEQRGLPGWLLDEERMAGDEALFVALRCGPHERDWPALFERHPRLRRVSAPSAACVMAIPDSCVSVEVRGEALPALTRRQPPALRRLDVVGSWTRIDEFAALERASWRDELESLSAAAVSGSASARELRADLRWPELRHLALRHDLWPLGLRPERAPKLREVTLRKLPHQPCSYPLLDLRHLELERLTLEGLSAENLALALSAGLQPTSMSAAAFEAPPGFAGLMRLEDLRWFGAALSPEALPALRSAAALPMLRRLAVTSPWTTDSPLTRVRAWLGASRAPHPLVAAGPWEVEELSVGSLDRRDAEALRRAFPRLRRLTAAPAGGLADLAALCEVFGDLERLNLSVNVSGEERSPSGAAPAGLRLRLNGRFTPVQLDGALGPHVVTLNPGQSAREGRLAACWDIPLPRLV